MVIVEQAILHILDFTGGEAVLSGKALDLSENVREFIVKHVEKTVGSQDAKTGTFYENSEFAGELSKYLSDEMDFVAFSQRIAQQMFTALNRCEGIACGDFFVCQLRVADEPKLALLKCTSNQGYIHQVNVSENGGIEIEVMNSTGLLPSLSQRIEEFAYINVDTREVKFKAKKYVMDGSSVFVLPELILECVQAPSPRETLKEINKVVQKVAEAYCQDQVETAAAMKSYIAENLPEDGELDPQKVGEAVFSEHPSMQADYKQEMENAGFNEPVRVDTEATLKKMRKHKLSTDTGIELVIPTEFFENTEFVEFYRDEDGFMSITLKNIQNIINK